MSESGPKLQLRVTLSPIEASMGTKIGFFAQGDEIVVESLEKVAGLEPLQWRYDGRTLEPVGSGPLAAGTQYQTQQAPPGDLWTVAISGGVNVREAKNPSSQIIHGYPTGQLVRGQQEGNWLKLSG